MSKARVLSLVRLWNSKGSTFVLRQYPCTPVTSKGSECRMGKGKGFVDAFATWIRPGNVLFEIKNARQETAEKVQLKNDLFQALKAAAATLPLETRIVKATEMREPPRTLPHFIAKKVHALEFELAYPK